MLNLLVTRLQRSQTHRGGNETKQALRSSCELLKQIVMELDGIACKLLKTFK